MGEQNEEGRLASGARIQKKRRIIVSIDVTGQGHLSLLVDVVAHEFETRHEEERNEAQKNDTSGRREISDRRALRSLTILIVRFKTSLGRRLHHENNNTSHSVTTHDSSHILRREHGRKTEKRSNQHGGAETTNGSHSQNNTERSLGANDRLGKSVLQGNNGEDDNLDGKTDQETSSAQRARSGS